MKSIGEIIRKKRLEKGLSMEKLAWKAGLTYKTVVNIEKGKPFTMKTLIPICDILDLEFVIKEREV